MISCSKRILCVATMFLALLAGSAMAQLNWEFVATEAQITAVTGLTDFFNGEIAVDSSGLIAVVCTNGGDKILLITPGTPTTIQILASQADLLAAVNAANGTATDLTTISIQSLKFNANGKLIAYSDGSSPQTACLFALEPTVPTTINVLCCAVDANPSPVEGGNGLIVNGNTAYVLVDSYYGAAEDAVLSVDTSTLVNDGSKTATTLIGEAALMTATGQANPNDMSINDGAMMSATELLLINSGITNSNDNLIKVDVTGPTASLYLEATAIEADLLALDSGNTDVGYSSVTYANGVVYVNNRFGTGPADDGILILSNISSPSTVDTLLQTEGDVATMLGATGGNLNYGASDGLAYDAFNGRILYSCGGTGTDGVIASPLLTEVSDWSLF